MIVESKGRARSESNREDSVPIKTKNKEKIDPKNLENRKKLKT